MLVLDSLSFWLRQSVFTCTRTLAVTPTSLVEKNCEKATCDVQWYLSTHLSTATQENIFYFFLSPVDMCVPVIFSSFYGGFSVCFLVYLNTTFSSQAVALDHSIDGRNKNLNCHSHGEATNTDNNVAWLSCVIHV